MELPREYIWEKKPSLNVFVILNITQSTLTFLIKLFLSFQLGVYGDVHRVKIMFNKKENALVQMADASQAQLGTDD